MTKYEEYALLQKDINILEAKKDLLRSEIAEILPEEGFKSEIITAFWKITKKWKYSKNVDHIVESLKETKKREEEDGSATAEESKQLTISVK